MKNKIATSILLVMIALCLSFFNSNDLHTVEPNLALHGYSCERSMGDGGHGCGPATVGRAFSSGAPGETTCGSCHAGGSYGGDIFITERFQNAAQNGYVKGSVHALFVEVLSSDPFVNGGVQFTVLDTANQQAGFVLPPNTTNSNIANRFNWYRKLYMEHDRPIIPTQLVGVLKIYIAAAWIPSFNQGGPVTVYASAALCDGDSTANGDNEFTTQMTLYEAIPLGVVTDDSLTQTSSDQTYAVNTVYRNGILKSKIRMSPDVDQVYVEVYNMNRQCLLSTSAVLNSPSNTYSFEQPMPSGIYLMMVSDVLGRHLPIHTQFIVVGN